MAHSSRDHIKQRRMRIFEKIDFAQGVEDIAVGRNGSIATPPMRTPITFSVMVVIFLINEVKPNTSTARCIYQKDRLTCRKDLPNITYPSDVTHLELLEFDREFLDFGNLTAHFPRVENITIHGENIYRILPPPKGNNIKMLHLRHLEIRNISDEFLQNFDNLETLVLTENRLEKLETNFSYPLSKIKNVYISDNKWDCSNDLGWVLALNRTIIKDFYKMTCHEGDFINKPLGLIAKYMQDVKLQCPLLCKCMLTYVTPRCPTCDEYDPIIEVNCEHAGLTELPGSIPVNTTTFKLEGNSIDNLKPLIENPLYQSVRDLYLDNNKISSIDTLEGSYWLSHFRIFSLKGNKLTEIPTYALENALEQNPNMPAAVRIYFENNPWRCDCIFTPGFQELLRKYASVIKNLNNIKCSYVKGDENSLLPIIELSRSAFCLLPSEYSIQALDLLNIVLASLIVIIVGKLAYDYYYFKKTGKLPWIVTKMP